MYGQRPPGPPPPPPPFQQGLLAPPHPIMQQGLLPIPPRAGYQPGQPIYQHAPPPPHAPVHQGPQSHGGMFKVSQPYLHQPPPYRGSGPLPYLHPSSNQSSQYATHLFQNPPPPPHPSHGQAQYRTLGPTGGQGLHHAQLPLPPPAPQSQPPPPPPYGSFLQPPLGDSHMPPMNPPPPPPLPSSPPPRPPSPPPLTSPLPCSGTLPVPVDPSYLPSISGSEKVKGSKFRRFDCADNVASANHTGDNATMSHYTVNCVGLTGSDMNSIVKDGYLDRRSSVICDSLPPPRPKNENIVQKIETLCRLIVETGPASEDMAREKEVGKPEFEFLIGGEPGSEAAIAHEYFTWMKNNRTSEVISSQIVKLKESPLRPTETLLYSLADSDMEMEDNINQFHKDKEVHHSVDGPNLEFAVIRDELTVKEQLATSGSGNSLLAAQDRVSRSPSNRCKLEKPTTVSIVGGSSLSNVSAGSAGIRVGTYVAQHSEGGSPFRLLQDYSSDDSTDESEPCLDVVNPVTVGVGHSSLSIDPSDNMETNVGSESSYKDESKSRSLYQEALAFSPNRISTKAPEFSPVSKMNVESIAESSVPSPVAFKQDEQHDGGRQLINHFASQDSFQKEDDTLDDVNLNDVPDHCNMNSKDAKCSSPQLKIDEFGRLVRQEESGSGSDDFLHTRRRGKRGRSRSRSLSPRDKRRRSPRRRRRSPSRSRSPRKRSRSRSPINRRIADHGGEKLKRGRGQIPDCLDFRRGKCHRGASCRFLHPMSDTTAESKRYKSRHKHGEASPNLNHKEVQGDSNINDYDNVDAKKGYMQSVNSDNDGLLLGTDVDFLVPSKPVSDAGTLEMPEDTAEAVLSGVGMFEKADRQPQLVDGVSVSDSSHDQTSVAFAGNFLLTKPSTTELHHSANSMGQPFSENSSSQLPPLFSPPLPQSTNVPSKPQLSTAYDFLQPTQSTLFQSAPGVNIPAYQVSIPGQQHHTSLPPNPTSTSLPPPPPPPPAVNPLVGNGAVAIPTFPYTQQSQPPINDFPSQTFFRPHLSTLPNHSYDGGHLPVQEHHRVPLPGGNSLQPFADANHTNFPSSSYAQGNVHTQALPPNEIYKASYGNHHFSHHQPQPYGLQYSAPHETLPRNTVSLATRFLSDILEKNQISRLPDFVESKIPTHYNPYASTFDQPLSSKFSSSSFIQEKEAPSGFSHLPGDGLGAGSIGSRQMSSSNSARVDPQNLPISGGDQYDPLFDSIDKSPKLLEKYDSVQKWDCIDEFGETADAEVGAVENGSPRSSPIDMENASTGEIEIDQIKSPGKRKKNKDSKSMKLFRIAVANFVKEVLKPSWRQGNMSKEAFKTIVKKTVDKVSGALKGNQIPKSQAKINQYIDSSQRKLTKLVMGYVDKYVKA